MTGLRIGVLGLCLLSLSGCGRAGFLPSASHGEARYSGVGLYPAGQGWSRIVVSAESTPTDQAKRADDETVIVVVDGATGEVRQCGNLSGYCVAMNPWNRSPASLGAQPVRLTPPASEPSMPIKGSAQVKAN